MSGNAGSMIDIVDLKKSYGEVTALCGLNFSVPKGQIVGFLGPNGAGKSTTMKILTGYLPYSIGSVKVGGIEVAKDPIKAQRLIGYLPENNPQYEDMMVYEFLSFIAKIRAVENPQKKIWAAISRCDLKEVAQKDISELSRGYRQRVGLAQAILHEPQLLILDEPTSGLDPNQIIEIRNLIKELSKETTILMSTHILQEAHSTCQRILIINNGLLVADDTPEELVNDGGEVALELKSSGLDAEKFKNKLLQIPGLKHISYKEQGSHTIFIIAYEKVDPRAEIFKAVVSSSLILLELRRQKISLEDTFRRLTKGQLRGVDQ